MIPIYAKELNRNKSDFSVLLLAQGIAYIIGSVVNPKYHFLFSSPCNRNMREFCIPEDP